MLGAPTGDDVPSEELSKRLARRTLDALHPKAVEKLEPEFGVVKNGTNRQQFQITFYCKVCGMTARSHVTGIEGHKTIKVNTSSTRTLDDAAKECAEELYRWHQKCLPTQHFLAQVGHKQELKLDDAKTEALRLQQQLEKDASTLALGADVPLDHANRKDFDANDMERHVCAHFAAPRGHRKTNEVKRQRVESGGDAFDALMDAGHQQRTPSTSLQRGRLHKAMHDATFGVVDKVVPFVCVVSFVDKATFDDTAAVLAEGDEVTVVTDAGHFFWAKVELVDRTGTDARYHVRDALGNETSHARASLHKRIWVTTALIGFTSDRKHDSYATQFFLNKALAFAATEHHSQGFTEVHIHSDNAGSAR